MTIARKLCLGATFALLAATQAPQGEDLGPTQKSVVVVPMHLAPAVPGSVTAPAAATQASAPSTNPPAGIQIIAPAALSSSILAFDADLKSATVKAGDTAAQYSFSLTNVSAGNVTISNVASACGCTTTKMPPLPWTLAPGTNGVIQVTLDVAGHSNEVFKAISVNTDKGAKTLIVQARFLPPPAPTTAATAAPPAATPLKPPAPAERAPD